MTIKHCLRVGSSITGLFLIAAAGCGDTGGTPDLARDLSVPGDMTPAPDLSMPDFRPPPDLLMPDLRPPPDLVPPGPSATIQFVRDAASSTTPAAVTIAVKDVIVTYLKPLVGMDAAGFFVQAEQKGPAVFVAVDPATLSPVPVVGDKVSFTVTTAVRIAGDLRTASTIKDWMRVSQGNDVAALVQDVNMATDLITGLDNYESEMVKFDGTLSGPFAAAGTGHVSAQIDTAAIMGMTNIKLRLPATLQGTMDLSQGCAVTVKGTPMWRFGMQAQPSAWVQGDLTVKSCPAPKVVSAIAQTATAVTITFDRLIDPNSVLMDGSQFTFDNNLTATGAAVMGKTVTVTTAMQTGGTKYTVTVANSVKDTYGVAVPNGMNTATFNGFVTPAKLILNEMNPNISGGVDLIELRVVGAGSTENIKVEQAVATPQVLVTLPALNVQMGDLIVVHINPPMGVTSESTSKTQCMNTACYSGAWDVNGGTTGATFSNRVVTIRGIDGKYQDAVPFIITSGTPPSAFPGDLQMVQGQGLWLPADCGGKPCDYMSTPTALAISVDWSSVGTTPTGKSAQRTGMMDTNAAADWTIPNTPTWGAPNM